LHCSFDANALHIIQFDGFKTFEFYLNIPFFALREDNELCRDHRTKPNGEPLRCFWSVDRLTRLSSTKDLPARNAYIYEAQTSVTLFGIDDRTYNVYAAHDTYYDPRSKYSVQTYHETHAGSPQTARDPLSRGTKDLNRPPWESRLCFLITWANFLELAVLEWKGVTRFLKEVGNKM